MPARLVPLSPGLNAPISLERPVVLIGRHPECDFHLPHPRVSLRHCCVAQVDEHLVVRDLGSINGVRVNGYRVEESLLEHDDELAIGPLIFRLDAPLLGKGPLQAADISLPSDDADDDDDLVPLDD